MVVFQLDNTLSEHGTVTRGICTVKGEKLDTVIETGGLKLSTYGIKSERDIFKWSRASIYECLGFYA